MSQAAYRPHYEHLKNKWTDLHRKTQRSLWDKHGPVLRDYVHRTKHTILGTAGGLMMLMTPLSAASGAMVNPDDIAREINKNVFLISELTNILPQHARELTPEEEKRIGELLTEKFGFTVTPELEGKRLNRSYGYIGAEQHLMRYPGDTLATHFATAEEAALYGRSGMAPGRGAWGYFVPTGEEMTQKDAEREKYYIAVQTFLAPGYNQHVHDMYSWFKFRKMLLVNPHNGRAVVTVIGDAGPAQWTGKHLGGSPEVMKYLERFDGYPRGAVLYFFIDDPEDKITLGPVHVQ